MGRKLIACLAVFLFLAGACVLLYPMASNLINRQHGSYAIQELGEQLKDMDEDELHQALDAARDYNRKILSVNDYDSEALGKIYDEILNFGNGIMGYIHIPAIDVKLPIYHGVDTGVLEKGVGHMPASAFPIGGRGNHTVLTGHTGLPSARLFTDLAELEEGDRFQVVIGGMPVSYQVDRINVVLPEETEDLKPVPGEDYCTLVTCTPYGVNSHRLLVRGSRVETEEVPTQEMELIAAEKERGIAWWLLPVPAVFVGILVFRRKRRKKNG